MQTHRMPFKRLTLFVIGLLVATPLIPKITYAAAIPSAVPSVTVARGQKAVSVLDFSLPAYTGDAVVDADGSLSYDVGVTRVLPGAFLYTIAPSARLAYGIGG